VPKANPKRQKLKCYNKFTLEGNSKKGIRLPPKKSRKKKSQKQHPNQFQNQSQSNKKIKIKRLISK
jgi:hypothetical protein